MEKFSAAYEAYAARQGFSTRIMKRAKRIGLEDFVKRHREISQPRWLGGVNVCGNLLGERVGFRLAFDEIRLTFRPGGWKEWTNGSIRTPHEKIEEYKEHYVYCGKYHPELVEAIEDYVHNESLGGEYASNSHNQ